MLMFSASAFVVAVLVQDHVPTDSRWLMFAGLVVVAAAIALEIIGMFIRDEAKGWFLIKLGGIIGIPVLALMVYWVHSLPRPL